MKKHLIYATLLAATGGLVVTSAVAAHGKWGGPGNFSEEERQVHHQEMLEEKAEVLGISVEELEAKFEEGVRPHELAAELGIDEDEFREKMGDRRKQMMEEKLAEAVVAGELTQEEADEKLQRMEECKGMGLHGKRHRREGPK